MYHACTLDTYTTTNIYTSYTLILYVLYSLNEVSGEREGDEAYSDAYENELSDYSSSLDQMNNNDSGDDDDSASDSTTESSSSGSSRRSGSSGSYTPVTSAEGEGEDEEYFDWTHIAKGRHKRPLHSSSSTTTTTAATSSNTVFPSISASFSTTQPTSTSSVKRSSSSSPSSSSSSQSLWESSSSMTNLQTIKASTQTRRPVKNNGK